MKESTTRIALGAVSIGAILASLTLGAQTAKGASHGSFNLLGEGIGLVAYDPVSYFPEGGSEPERGLIGISTQYQGVTYRFTTEQHKALFVKNPAKFVPQYGGWCTWAVAELGKRVDVDPESYVLKNGKLYVFYRDKALDTRAKFLDDPEGMLAKAEANWPRLSK